ncbi:cytochrome c [Tahibacter sp. UC22_41]|uniref:cytochrome c n=1 Tax=Tahibacter sp. UC22_41 TaxID=3350178 RepID=UPI0036DF567C
MRSLLILLAGLLIGALVAFSAANSLHQRNAWPRGVMNTLQHHLAELRRLQRSNDCGAARSAVHFRRLAETAADIVPSHPDQPADFAEQARRFADAGARHAAEPPVDCRTLDQALQQTGEACQGCHRDYR